MKWLIDWIKKLLNLTPKTSASELDEAKAMQELYESITEINFTAMIANKLARKVVADSDFTVVGDNKRAMWLNDSIGRLFSKLFGIVSLAFGNGGMVLVPYINNGKGFVSVVPQSNFVIVSAEGDDIISACIVADSTVYNNKKYYRVNYYSLDKGNLIISNRVFNDSGRVASLSDVPSWANMSEDIVIQNVERLPFGYLKCPTDSRRANFLRGVSITYGAESLIAETKEFLKDLAKEYKLKKVSIGVADAVRGMKNDEPIPEVFSKIPGIDKDDFWQLFNPGIRDQAFYNRLNSQLELIEKSVGVSEGILTRPRERDMTAREVKSNQQDTYFIVKNMQKNIQGAFEDVAYAFDVLCNFYSINPSGEFTLSFDWDLSLLEDSSETWLQLKEGKSMGAISKAEIRQFLKGGTLSEAQVIVDEIEKSEPSLDGLLGG